MRGAGPARHRTLPTTPDDGPIVPGGSQYEWEESSQVHTRVPPRGRNDVVEMPVLLRSSENGSIVWVALLRLPLHSLHHDGARGIDAVSFGWRRVPTFSKAKEHSAFESLTTVCDGSTVDSSNAIVELRAMR